jgi:hypothetical protein
MLIPRWKGIIILAREQDRFDEFGFIDQPFAVMMKADRLRDL